MPEDVAMIEVSSSNIRAIGYDPSREALYVEFNNGGTWLYRNVPAKIHRDFLGADSKGRFFSTRIRGVFTSSNITPVSSGAPV